MAYARRTLTCPDCGAEFPGTTERKVQRCFRCAVDYQTLWIMTQIEMRGLSRSSLQRVRVIVNDLQDGKAASRVVAPH